MLIDARTCCMLFDTRRHGLRAENPRRPSACSPAPYSPTRVEWFYAPALAAPLLTRSGHSHGVHYRRRPCVPATADSAPTRTVGPTRLRLVVALHVHHRLSSARHGVS
eukprot:7382534-Prymnesium_polylepis.3